MNDFWKENDLDGSQGDLRALGHPQRPQQAQPRRVQQVPVMFIKNWHHKCLYAIFQRKIDLKQSQCDTGWSRGSRTPSVTSSSSTMGSTASTSHVHQNLTRHMLISYYSKTNRFKVVPRGSRWSQAPTSSRSTMVSSASDMTHVYWLSFNQWQIDL